MASTDPMRENIDNMVRAIEEKVKLMHESGISDPDLCWRLSIAWVLEQNYVKGLAHIELLKQMIEAHAKRSERN